MRAFVSIVAFILLSGGAMAADKVVYFQNLSPISSVSIVAKAKNLFEQNGLNVEVRNVTSGKLALDALIGGSSDFASVSEVPMMRAALAGQSAVIVATMEKSDVDVRVLSRPDLGVKSLKDLKGKRVSTPVGTSAEYMLLKALESVDLKLSDVTVVSLRPQDMAAALSRGDIDAYAVWQPHVYNGERLLAGKSVKLEARGIYVETFNIAAMQNYVQKNPDVVQRFLKAMIASENFIKENPEEAKKIVSEALQMDMEALSAIWADFEFKVTLDASIVALMKQQAAWDISTGKPASVPDVNKALEAMVSTESLKAVAPAKVTGF